MGAWSNCEESTGEDGCADARFEVTTPSEGNGICEDDAGLTRAESGDVRPCVYGTDACKGLHDCICAHGTPNPAGCGNVGEENCSACDAASADGSAMGYSFNAPTASSSGPSCVVDWYIEVQTTFHAAIEWDSTLTEGRLKI